MKGQAEQQTEQAAKEAAYRAKQLAGVGFNGALTRGPAPDQPVAVMLKQRAQELRQQAADLDALAEKFGAFTFSEWAHVEDAINKMRYR